MLSFYSIAVIVSPMTRRETRTWCGMSLRGTSRQQLHVPERKRSIADAVLYWWELMLFYQRISRIIFKICFSRSCSPSWATKQTYFGNFILLQKHLLKTMGWVFVRLHHGGNLLMTWIFHSSFFIDCCHLLN